MYRLQTPCPYPEKPSSPLFATLETVPDATVLRGAILRLAPAGGIIGWDMCAALALAAALGINVLAVAELLPGIEAVMVRKINQQMDQDC